MGNQHTKPLEITQVSIPPKPDVPISSQCCQLPNSVFNFLHPFSSAFKQKSLNFFKTQENIIRTCETVENSVSSMFVDQSQRLSLLVTKPKISEIRVNFSLIKSSVSDLKSEIESLESLIYKLGDLLPSSPVRKN